MGVALRLILALVVFWFVVVVVLWYKGVFRWRKPTKQPSDEPLPSNFRHLE